MQSRPSTYHHLQERVAQELTRVKAVGAIMALPKRSSRDEVVDAAGAAGAGAAPPQHRRVSSKFASFLQRAPVGDNAAEGSAGGPEAAPVPPLSKGALMRRRGTTGSLPTPKPAPMGGGAPEREQSSGPPVQQVNQQV